MSTTNKRETAIDPERFEDPLSDFEPPTYENGLEQALAEQTSMSMKTRPYLSISPSTPIRDAVQMLYGSEESIALVVENERLVGVFTERDVLDRVSERFHAIAHRPVSEVMTSDPTVVYETDPAGTAVAAIAVAGHRHVPVLDIEGHLIGVVGPQRVFQFMQQHL